MTATHVPAAEAASIPRYGFHPNRRPSSTIDFGVTRDGLTQLRRRWMSSDPWASALLVHGISEHSGRYEHVGQQLADAGISTVAFDQRGFGQSGGARAYVDSWSQLHDDVEDHLVELRSLGLPTVLIGHSMGGLVSFGYAVDDRPHPEAVVLSAPALGAAAPKWMMKGAPAMARIAPKARLSAPFDPSVLSRDPALVADYEADPLMERKTSTRLGAELFAAIEWANRNKHGLRTPTLVLHGADDQLVPAAMSAQVADLPTVTRQEYPELRHEIFNEPEGPELISETIDWIRATLQPVPAAGRDER